MRLFTVLVLVYAAGCAANRSDDHVMALNEIVHLYTQDVSISARAVGAIEALELECAPYAGYFGEGFVSGGMSNLVLEVQPTPLEDCRPSLTARTVSVQFSIRSWDDAALAKEQINAKAGSAPDTSCRLATNRETSEQRLIIDPRWLESDDYEIVLSQFYEQENFLFGTLRIGRKWTPSTLHSDVPCPVKEAAA